MVSSEAPQPNHNPLVQCSFNIKVANQYVLIDRAAGYVIQVFIFFQSPQNILDVVYRDPNMNFSFNPSGQGTILYLPMGRVLYSYSASLVRNYTHKLSHEKGYYTYVHFTGIIMFEWTIQLKYLDSFLRRRTSLKSDLLIERIYTIHTHITRPIIAS